VCCHLIVDIIGDCFLWLSLYGRSNIDPCWCVAKQTDLADRGSEILGCKPESTMYTICQHPRREHGCKLSTHSWKCSILHCPRQELVHTIHFHIHLLPTIPRYKAAVIVMKESPRCPPVLLLSHGTTMLAGKQSHVRDYWQYHGQKAVEYPIKGVVMMLSSVKVYSDFIRK
jgi:hypothetical protein